MQICYILLICIFAIHLIHTLAILLINILAILLIPILGNTPNTHFGNTATTHFGNTPNTHFGNTANTHFGNTANTHFGNAWWYCIRKRFAASIPGRLEWEVTLKATTAAEAENAILRQQKSSECIVSSCEAVSFSLSLTRTHTHTHARTHKRGHWARRDGPQGCVQLPLG